jgi:large subunit ribosomal protein L21
LYAIIQANGRQVKVAPGAVVEIDGIARIEGAPLEKGAKVTFDRVLLVEKDAGDVLAGAPFVADARVLAVIEGQSRGPKLRVFKKKRRKGFRKTRGHRSVFTRVRITEIQA